jgi:hypothetical protein
MVVSGMTFVSSIVRRTVVERFLKGHKDRHMGSIAGFDRLLFRGVLRSICYAEGLSYFMGNQRVPFKGFKAFVEKF